MQDKPFLEPEKEKTFFSLGEVLADIANKCPEALDLETRIVNWSEAPIPNWTRLRRFTKWALIKIEDQALSKNRVILILYVEELNCKNVKQTDPKGQFDFVSVEQFLEEFATKSKEDEV